jgi:uncharacterized membrane protein (DUF485 family)
MEAPVSQPPSVMKVATKYGLIQGVIGFLLFVIVAMTGMRQNWMTSSVSIVVLVVLIVLAHREFKKANEGIMSYGQGVGVGTVLSVIASAVSCILLYIYVNFINTGYPAAALKIQQAALEERGMTGAQLDQAMSMTSAMMTPVAIVVTALISGIVVGFVVALIVSAFTKCSDPRAVI